MNALSAGQFEIDMGLASRRCCRRRRAFSPWI